MHSSTILLPSLAHMFLVLLLYILLLARKKEAAREGNVNFKKASLDIREWPESVVQVSNNIDNQFQLPVFFHLVCLALAVTDGADASLVAVAWAFVVTRVIHAAVHVTSNHVPRRRSSFTAGVVILLALIVRLAIHLLQS